MKYPIANNYIDTLERVVKQLHRIAYTELHPESLAYEEIQALAYEVNSLDIMKLYREAVNSDDTKLYKGQFSDILSNNLVVNGTARNRLTILPYYPAGVTIEGDNGNKIIISASDNGLIGSELDAKGNTVATQSVISYLFDGDKITKRLLDEGRNANYIVFFLSQTNQLQEAIFERWEDVRVMFYYIEKRHLDKFKNKDFTTSLLEYEGKAKPEAWKVKPELNTNLATFDDINNATNQHYKPCNTYIMPNVRLHGKSVNLYTYLQNKGKGCLRPLERWDVLLRALDSGVLSEIANGNRLDILYYVFMVYADKYIHKDSRDQYKESIRQQIERFGKSVKDNLHKEEKDEINKLMQ